MGDEAIRYTITATGADATAKAFERVAGSQKVANDQFKQLSQHASKTAVTFAALGGSLGRVTPEFGALGSAVGRASGAIQAMTGVLGGPWGIAVGAAIAALGLLSESMRKSREETEAATKAIGDNAEAERERIRSRFEMQAKYRASQQEATDLLTAASGLDDQANLEAVNKLAERYEKQGMIDDNIPDKERTRQPDPLFAAMQRRDATNHQLAALNKMDTGRSAFGGDGGRAALEAKEADNVAFLDAHRSFREDLLEEDRRYHEANAALEAEAAKRRERYQGVAIDAAQSLERVSISGMQKIAKGQKFTVRELLSGIGDEMVAGGTKWIMEGTGRLIASYGTDPSGWGLIGLGSAEVGFGLGLGAATRAGSPGGSAGGRQRPMSPMGGGGGGGPSEPQHITINMPTVVSPGPQDGVRVQQALDEARRSGLVRAA